MNVRPESDVKDRNINKSFRGILRVSPVEGGADAGVEAILEGSGEVMVSDSEGTGLPISVERRFMPGSAEYTDVLKLGADGGAVEVTAPASFTSEVQLNASSMEVNGPIRSEGTLTVRGDADVSGALRAGSSTLSGSLDVNGNVTASGSGSFGGTVTAYGKGTSAFGGPVTSCGRFYAKDGADVDGTLSVRFGDKPALDVGAAVTVSVPAEFTDDVLMDGVLRTRSSIIAGDFGSRTEAIENEAAALPGSVALAGSLRVAHTLSVEESGEIAGRLKSGSAEVGGALAWSGYALPSAAERDGRTGDLAMVFNPDSRVNRAGTLRRFELVNLRELFQQYLEETALEGGYCPVGSVFHIAVKEVDGRCVGYRDALDGFFAAQPGRRGHWDLAMGQSEMSYSPDGDGYPQYNAFNFPELYTTITGESLAGVDDEGRKARVFSLPDAGGRFIRSVALAREGYAGLEANPTEGMGRYMPDHTLWSTEPCRTNGYGLALLADALRRGGQGKVGIYTSMPQDSPWLWDARKGQPQGCFYDAGYGGGAGNEGRNRRSQQWNWLGINVMAQMGPEAWAAAQVRETHPPQLVLLPVMRVK